MKDRYTPKIGKEFDVVTVTVERQPLPRPETIQEITKSIVLLSTLALSTLAFFIAWIHGMITGNYVALAIAVPTVISALTFVFMWYSRKTEIADKTQTIRNDASTG